MNFIPKIFQKKTYTPTTWQAAVGMASASGAVVTADNAMQISTVYSCVRLLADSIGQLPMVLYRRTNEGRERAADHSLYKLLHTKPNGYQTSQEFYETIIISLLLRGNAYAHIIRGADGRLLALNPIGADSVTYELKGGRRVYSITNAAGRLKQYDANKIFHITSTGGLSVIACARETLGLAKTQETFGAANFKNGARPAGVLEVPGALDAPGRKALREAWNKSHQGAERTGSTAVLENGMKFTPVAINSNDAQWLESRRYSREDIAALFSVPVFKIGGMENATYSNIESQSRDFVTYSLMHWLRRIESCIMRDLIDDEQLYCEFLVAGLLRGDIKTRYDSYAIGLDKQFLTIDEVRAFENLNKLQGQTLD